MTLIQRKKKKRRNKEDWRGMTPSELTRLMANRYGRIEVLKMEVKELQRLIGRKMKEL